ncbi:SusD/RagB family nutrient-binding outer membrane lipoprotein [Hymenobacter agri]
MKYSSLFRYATAGAMLLAASSCNKDTFFGDNLDPNNPQVVPPGVILTNLEAHTAFVTTNTVGRVAELFMQRYAGVTNQPTSYDVYSIRGEFDNEWQFDLYAGTLADAQNIIDNGAKNGPAYTGIAKLLKAYNFGLVTDLWGDVPYSQALLGSANLQPRFDKQEDIYKGNSSLGIQSLFDLVRDGLADLDKPAGSTVPTSADDLIYKGDLSKWKKFGNTLLLKFALQISKKEPALATSIIKEVLAKGATSYISDNADDFQLAFGTTVGNQNPFYSYNVTNRSTDQMASKRFIDSLNLRNDPRLPRFYTNSPANAAATTTAFGLFTGYNNGSNTGVPGVTNRSVYNTYILGVSGEAPVRMLTNFQTKFILAEAALVLNTGENAQTRFTEGITASMLKAGVAQSDITAYLGNAANRKYVTLGGSTPSVSRNQILSQKWIALFGNGYESWNDYRRTGFPRLAPVDNPSADSPVIPQRFFYTLTEISSNANNIPNPRPNITVPVWWAN